MQDLKDLLGEMGGMVKLDKDSKGGSCLFKYLSTGEEEQNSVNIFAVLREDDVFIKSHSYNFPDTKRDNNLVFSKETPIEKADENTVYHMLKSINESRSGLDQDEIDRINLRLRTICTSALGLFCIGMIEFIIRI